jgi:lysophospholipase L1-like esterase
MESIKSKRFGMKQKILLLFFSFFIVVLSDFTLRIIYPTNKPIALYQVDNSAEIYLEDFSLGWKLIPDLKFKAQYNFLPPLKFPLMMRNYSIDTNSIGLRNRELEKSANKKKVICLGDSITFGWNVDQNLTYPIHLEWLLNAKYPGQFEVVNAGVPGYTSRQGLVFYAKKLRKLKPAFVIISFGANDSTFAPIPDKNSIRYKSASAVLHELLSFSRIYTLLRGSMLPLKKSLFLYNVPTVNNELVARVSPMDYYGNLVELLNEIAKDGCKPILLTTTEENEYSKKMDMIAKEKNIMLVKGYLTILSHKKEIFTDRRFINLRRLYVDLLGEPNLMAYPDYFLFVDPVHPSAIGHKIIAEKLFEKINLIESGV